MIMLMAQIEAFFVALYGEGIWNTQGQSCNLVKLGE